MISAILRSIFEDVFDGVALVSRCSMLANVLDAPVAELSMCDDVDLSQNFVDTRPLDELVSDGGS